MKISIITGPFMCLPPFAIGAIEKRWYNVGNILSKTNEVYFISKEPVSKGLIQSSPSHIYIKGYSRTNSWLKDCFLDLIYSYKALKKAPPSNIVILNSIWSPILYPLFKKKLKHSLYNVARFPKKQLGLYHSIDCFSCVSLAVYNNALIQTPNIKNKLCVINNPIDTHNFYFKGNRKCSKTPTIVYSGRIHKEKGLDILISAINILNNKGFKINLSLIGTKDIAKGGSGDEYVNYLNSLATSFTINWIEPIYNPSELADELNKGDIFCYPSVAEKGETFGVAPLEAMGIGLPTIVSDLDCFKDFVKNEETGLIFNHKSPHAIQLLSEQVLRLIQSDDLYQKLSYRGSEKAKLFSTENIANDYYKKFLELIHE